jgi:hypothetical protein
MRRSGGARRNSIPLWDEWSSTRVRTFGIGLLLDLRYRAREAPPFLGSPDHNYPHSTSPATYPPERMLLDQMHCPLAHGYQRSQRSHRSVGSSHSRTCSKIRGRNGKLGKVSSSFLCCWARVGQASHTYSCARNPLPARSWHHIDCIASSEAPLLTPTLPSGPRPPGMLPYALARCTRRTCEFRTARTCRCCRLRLQEKTVHCTSCRESGVRYCASPQSALAPVAGRRRSRS